MSNSFIGMQGKFFCHFHFALTLVGSVAFWQGVRPIDLCRPVPRVGFGSHWSVTLHRKLSVLAMKALRYD